jgi:RNA polymerase sigma-54 factor
MQFSPSILSSQRQSVVVNQQMQQAITFLQMSNSELQAFIESQADENPFVSLRQRTEPQIQRSAPSSGASGTDWDRIGALADDGGPSLYAHVARQIDAMCLNAVDNHIAELFLDALAPSGWLDATVTEVALRAGVTTDHAETVLIQVQRCEPTGVFARDLAECLRLQATERGILTPVFSTVLNNLPLLATADLNGLCRVCRTDMTTLRSVLRQLRGLDPKPGAQFDQGQMPLRAPDLLVTRLPDGGWKMELNNSTLPAVMVRDTDAPSRPRQQAADYLAERLSVARWLSRAVQYRNQTVLKIGAEILRNQKAFFEHGADHLRPMILKDIADAVGIHESTVSRVSNAVTIDTPFGIMALKRFFSAALSAPDGNTGSAEAVRSRIRKLIQAEPNGRPLSDEALVGLLETEGVCVARRTVAKYREQLRIPTAALRRRQAALSAQM